MHVLFVWPRPSLGTFICVQVEKRHADSLTFSEFFFQYALTHTPVVITGLVGHMTPTPWTLDYIKTVCCHTNTHGTAAAIKPLIFALKWLWYQFTMKCTSQMYNASFSPLSAKFFSLISYRLWLNCVNVRRTDRMTQLIALETLPTLLHVQCDPSCI